MSRALSEKIRVANSRLIVEGDLDAADEYFAPDYVAHLTKRDMKGGPKAVRAFVSKLRSGFADLVVDVEILVESRDRVAWQRTLRAEHAHDFMGFPATRRRIVWRDMVTSRFQGGLIAEEWSISDLAEQLLRARKP